MVEFEGRILDTRESGAPGETQPSHRRLEDRLRGLLRRHHVPGAQLVIRGGREPVAIELGELEHGRGEEVTRGAAFPVGSITKAFTATLAMMLVADGDIELDGPISEHLPAIRDLGGRLTLRHLLSHTSGLASGPSSEEVTAASLWRYVVDHCHRRNLVVAPGTAFSYSNLGYVLVGHLVEMVTGMSWWEAMESILLRPLGIEPVFVAGAAPRAPACPIASGHAVHAGAGRTRPVRQSLAPAEAPAGGLALSAESLAAFGAIHAPGEGGRPPILPPAVAAEMRRAAPSAEPFGLADGWGLGLAVFRSGETTWFGHDGNGDGTACYLRVDPIGGRVVALTSNASTGFGMWQELRAALEDEGIPIGGDQARPGAAAIAPPAECAGTYLNGDAEYVVAEGADGRLRLVVDGDAVGQLTIHPDLSFSLREDESGEQVFSGRFMRRSPGGAIDGIQFGGRLARARARVVRNAAAGKIA